MLPEILALLIGILAGTITGLIPGVHINLIATILIASLASLPFLNLFPLTAILVFIVAMAISHSFLDFIPSIYLGAPDEDSFLSVLPGHQLLKEGLGHEATSLTLLGSLTALPIILIFTPIFIFILPKIHQALTYILPFILIFASLYLIFREEEFLISLTVFILAGFLGLITFNLPVKEPLLPLLTGLFGASALAISLKSPSVKLTKQIITPINKIKLKTSQLLKSSFAAAIAAPLCSFLPGIGSGHAAVIASEITENDKHSFLFLVGTINTIVIALSFITLFSLNRTRSGAAVAIKELLNTITIQNLILIVATIIISGIIAFILGIQISKITAKRIHKINYKTLSLSTLLILLIINLIFTNTLGIIILITATSLGIFTILSRARRINLMGVLLIPTILFYLL
jgi:putative membrane protein